MKFIVEKEIFEKLPNACFGVVMAKGIDNTILCIRKIGEQILMLTAHFAPQYNEETSPTPHSKGAGLRFCAVKIILTGSSRCFFLCPLFSVRRLIPACAKRPRWSCR